MNLQITFEIVKGKLVCPYQDQVENVALETLGTHHNVYFDPVPLTDKFDVIWSDNGWVLRYQLET